jgi:hypothetical protein
LPYQNQNKFRQPGEAGMSNLHELLLAVCNAENEITLDNARKNLESSILKPSPSPGIAGAFNKSAIALIPEIIIAACNNNLDGREWFIDLLLSMAIGNPSEVDFYGFDYQEYAHTLSPAMDECYQAIENELTKISKLLEDPSPKVRASAAYLLSFFSQKAKTNAKIIAAKLDAETDPGVKASFQFAVATLDSYQNSLDHWPIISANIPHTTGKDLIQDIIVASTLHYYKKTNEHKNFVMQVLFKTLASTQPIPTLQNFKWSNGDLLNRILMEVMTINMEDTDDQLMIDNLIPLCARIDEGTTWGELTATRALYQLFTPCTRNPPPDEGWKNWQQVPAPLKRFVSVCLDHPKHLTSTILNALGDNGLPSDLSDIKKFAGK